MHNTRILISVLIVIALSFAVPATTNAADIGVNINGVAVNFSPNSGFPFIDTNNRTLVPLRITMEAYGCQVDWDNVNKVASVTKGGTTVLVPIGQKHIVVNGTQISNDTRAQIVNSRTYLPIRAVLEAFGATVGWDAAAKTVTAIAPNETVKYEIAMITDSSSVNDMSFNQDTWKGIVSYATLNQITHKYYTAEEQNTEAIMESIRIAVENGAKVIINPGFLFAEPVFLAQDLYKNVTFILLDETPRNADWSVTRTNSNTVAIKYAEEQAGYLAGYAAVKDGYKNLGFIGGVPVQAVVRFGYGFLDGVNDAAKELGIININVRYHYSDNFSATPENQELALSWYSEGVEVIFACAGMGGRSVMNAAESSGGYVIGVDVDQSVESPTVITSAMKSLSASVQSMLTAYYKGEFPGGKTLLLGAEGNGVKLPMATSKFKSFSQADYDRIFRELADGNIKPPTDTDADSPLDLELKAITVTVIE